MRNNKLLYRFTSILNSLTLIFQLLYPGLITLATPANASGVPAASLAFDGGTNKFHFVVSTDKEVKYVLDYSRENGPTEAISGTETKSPQFEKEVYAGTCSNGTCVPHQVKKGLLKWSAASMQGAIVFVVDQNNLSVKSTYGIDKLDLTPDEEKWLNETDSSPPTSSSPAPTVATPKECLAEGTAVTTASDWAWNSDNATGMAETKDAVKLGVKYVFPQNNNVSVTFHCLPKDASLRTNLKIQQVKTADLKLPTDLNTVGEYAYDITTGMEDGTFSYDVTLPKAEGNASISYIEKSVETAKNFQIADVEVQKIDENKTVQQDNSVKATSIDHFTIFIVSTEFTGSNSPFSVLLNGGDRVVVNQPGASINLSMTVGANSTLWSTYRWRSTAWRVGGSGTWTCVNTTDHSHDDWLSTEYFTESFPITAQNSVSTKDLEIRIYDNDTCSGSSKDSATMYDAITVKNITTNPSLPPQSCGLDIALVLDTSTSILGSDRTRLNNAMKTFVDALHTTPTQYSLTKFSYIGSVVEGFTTNHTLIDNRIDSATGSLLGTNWQDGLTKANSTFAAGRLANADLVIVASDGNPNRTGSGGSIVFESTAVADAQVVANTIKSRGARIITLGIDDDIDMFNMQTISGSNINTGNVLTSDVITQNFSTYATQLATYASQNCRGTIVVDKVTNPTGSTQSFAFSTTGTGYAGFNLTDTAAPNSQSLIPGGYSVAETPVSGWNSTSSCTSSIGDTETPGNLELDAGETITCTFTNTRHATIQVNKITNPTGDQTSFPISISGNGQIFGSTTGSITSTSPTTFEVMPGTYSVTETVPSGWTQDVNGNGCAQVTVGVPVDGRTVWDGVCNIFNSKIPTLTLVKSVINDNGGTAEPTAWTLTASGNTPISGTTGSPAVTNASVTPGDYILSEAGGPEGYTAGTFSCVVNGRSPLVSNSISLVNGDSAVCTITNYDLTPSLTLVKVVDNRSVGAASLADWTLNATGTRDNPTNLSGISPVTSGATFMTDTYTLSESSGPVGYTPSSWSCTNGVMVNENNQITLPLGVSTTCTITNTRDTGSITVVKKTVGGDGTFGFTSNFGVSNISTTDGEGSQTISGLATGSEYVISEIAQSGWDMNSAVCDHGTPNAVQVIKDTTTTCTFTNTKRGSIQVYKFEDMNGNGIWESGDSFLPGWDMIMKLVEGPEYTQTTDIAGSTLFSLIPGYYRLSEVEQDDWIQTGISCGNRGKGVLITAPGEAYGHHGACQGWNGCGDAASCAQRACETKGYSHVVSYGDQRPCTEFGTCNLFYSGGGVQMNWGHGCGVMGVTDITCSNDDVSDDSSGDGVEFDSVTHSLTVNAGGEASCYVGNFKKGKVFVKKYNDINDNGRRDENEVYMSDWTITLGKVEGSILTATTSASVAATFTDLTAGSYVLSEEIQRGWTQTNIDCGQNQNDDRISEQRDNDNSYSITIQSGAEITCEIGNRYVPPELTIKKFNDRWPNAQAPGSDVHYTIVLTALENAVDNPFVRDLLPKNIKYRAGSYKLVSSLHGDLTASIAAPTYASPGTWTLPSMEVGEELTLTYTGDVDGDIKPGIYKDMAWAQGSWTSGEGDTTHTVIAGSTASGFSDPGVVSDSFVGTKVLVDRNTSDNRSVNVIKEEQRGGMVLGATTELPGTGQPMVFTLLALGLLTVGGGLQLMARKLRRKHD